MSETRVLTDHERGMIAPFVQQLHSAKAQLQAAVNLLAGEAWKGSNFDLATMTFTRPESGRPFPQDPPAEPRGEHLSRSAES